ncbi:MAG TPA: serine hydrolase, partial [Thermoanaerobaculia bacterium]|nr:serine hydrolase [Thermoanaerobaculia bacterium]
LITCSAHAQWTPALDAEIEKARVAWEVPGIGLTVVHDGKVVVAKGYGVRRFGSPATVDAHTMFDIASLSKSFTAAAAATLVDEKKMSWDDPVRRHLPSFELADPYRTQNATMRDVLAHRLGLERADALFVFGNYTAAELLARMKKLDEVQGFRAGLTYHNIAYEAAAEAIATTAGAPFPAVLRKRLLEPLGMSESTVAVNHDAGVKNYSDGHSVSDGELRPIRARKALNILGANAVNSTPHDMAKWLLFELGDGTWEGKRIISAASMTEMHEPQIVVPTTPQFRASRGLDYFAGYALGWQVFDYHGHRLLWHSGGADGMPTYMAILPDDKLGVCVMVNTWHAPYLHGGIAARIIDAYLGRESKPDWAGKLVPAGPQLPAKIADTKPSVPIEQYAGTYVDDTYGDMVITQAGGKLALQFAGGERADLEHWHYDSFRLHWRDRAYDWADAQLTFALNAEGKPAKIEFRAGRAEIAATRKP